MTEPTAKLNYVKTSKKQLWDMVKALEAEKAGGNGTTTTTDVEKQLRTKDAFSSLKGLDIDAVETRLLGVVSVLKDQKKTLEDFDIAIAEKRAQLKSVHGLEAAANSAVLMLEAKEKLAREIDEDNAKKVQEAKDVAEELIASARSLAKGLEEEARAKTLEAEKEMKRQEEQWAYDFERSKKANWDAYQDKVNEERKALALREEKIEDVEGLLAEKDAEISELKTNLEELEKDIQKRVSAAEGKAKGMAEREAKHAQALFEAQQQNITKGLETDKTHLLSRLSNAKDRITELERQLSIANERVTSIATGALKAGADAATVTEVAKTIAAGAGGKK